MNFIKTDDTRAIDTLRGKLYQRLSGPIDGMWEALYIANSQAYIIKMESQELGYCCIDDNHNLTQIYLGEPYNYLMHSVIQALLSSKLIFSATLSSVESVSFNTCLAHSKSITPNTFCFQYAKSPLIKASLEELSLVTSENIQVVKTFYKDHVGFVDNFGYTENLVRRKELFMKRDGGDIIATGECRLSDSQTDFADIGMAVHKAHRRKGLGAQVLNQLAKKALGANRQPICSTTIDNIASQKAIQKAGFYCSHIIFDINFVEKFSKIINQ